MKLLMISGDRSVLAGRQGPFHAMLKEFSRHWERIDVITPAARDSRLATGNRAPFANVFFHPSPTGLLGQSGWILKRGSELIREFSHDVMTVHEYPPFYNGRGALALKKKHNIPMCLEIHHIVGVPRAASLMEWIGARLSRVVLPHEAKKADAVRIVSRSVGIVLERWGVSQQKIHLAPSFYLDRALLNPDPAIRKQWDVVFSGRFVANKGIGRLLEAIAMLSQGKALFIGDGPLFRPMQQLAQRLGIASRVRFTGWLETPKEVCAAIQSARCLVCPSASEGGPRIALEAMALGLPVIATPVGVIPDVIEDGVNGFLTIGSPRDLAEKIRILLNDETRAEQMGQKARTVLDRFEYATLISGYAHFLQGLART
jgi:glycosyltransferase involved in cell wall biosynthesis